MKVGIWVTILGILAIIAGGVIYAATSHHIIGLSGIILGIILIIVGVVLWMMKGKKAPMPTVSQPAQPAQPAKTT